MRRILFLSILLINICGSIAWARQAPTRQTSSTHTTTTLKVTLAGGKKIQVALGTQKSVIDLSKDVIGCLDTYDPTMPKESLKRRLGLKVIDKISKDDKHYLVLLTSAQSNCNIQGMCGAAEDSTLIWLKLDTNLTVEEKKVVVIEDCPSNIAVIEPVTSEKDTAIVKLTGGKLKLEYGNINDEKTSSTLMYDRKTPERGFVITIKKSNL